MVKREQLFQAENYKLIHAARSPMQADIYKAAFDGNAVAVKDISGRSRFWRIVLLRRILRHEYEVMAELTDIQGVPTAYGMVDKDGFVQEFVETEAEFASAKTLEPNAYPPIRLFDELERTVWAVHAKGFCCGDIRRKNVLLTQDGHPYVIDFATSFKRGRRWQFLRNMLHQSVCNADNIHVLELRAEYYPESVTPEQRARLANIPWLLRLGRYLRKNVYRTLIKPKLWRERWSRLKQFFFGARSMM